uniref:Carboxypeptidase n=1 Tax=Branchiostoma floridae TaxID=7739 RepID=C3YSQ9_BRAFL|eukprot:XP_002600748.1 hypothetical protein BRAFLDRAFT_83491 [Branchiostoma floridae]
MFTIAACESYDCSSRGWISGQVKPVVHAVHDQHCFTAVLNITRTQFISQGIIPQRFHRSGCERLRDKTMQGLRCSIVFLAVILVSQKSTALSRSGGGGPFRAMFPRVHHDIQQGQDYGDPLFLTPYLEQGMAEKARTLSEVNLPGTTINSYSGYLTVNKTYSSNLFFWFFPALSDPENAPLLLWLQGGPGGTDMYGLFTETGPFYITQDAQLMSRKVTWASAYSMLYIDNPVGTGFSFTKSDAGFSTNQEEVADNLYNALLQFYQIYPDFQKRDFYVTGESYAGKYVPALSYKIHMENPTAKFKINFKGMAIGDGLCDPINQYPALPDFLFNTGLCDENQAVAVRAAVNMLTVTQTTGAAVNLLVMQISEKMYTEAFKTFDALLNGDLTPYPSYFYNITGGSNYFNYLRTVEPPEQEYFGKYLARPEVRKAIHVGNLTFHDGSDVEKHLLSDVMQSVAPWIATIMDNNYKSVAPWIATIMDNNYKVRVIDMCVCLSVCLSVCLNLTFHDGTDVEKHLLSDVMQSVAPWIATIMDNNYKVLIYNGQLDVIVAGPLTEAFLQRLQWSKLKQYQKADRTVWKINPSDTEVAGFVRQVDNFYQVIVKGGGHILPFDQPERAFDMIDRFVSGRGFQ